MMDTRNPDNTGNHLEVYGYEGWPELQDFNAWDIPEEDKLEPEYHDD